MEALLKQLERVKLGFVATPAPGDLTLGGVLAIDGHGTGIPAQGESRLPGQSYGSLSNSIVALTAVVWDGAA
ncbi:FAD-linked oxidase, partial [Klebsiella pneumoniae]